MATTQPGELLIYDYRPSLPSYRPDKKSLKILQWNVERNYESDAIFETIKNLDPDVVVLQEIDIGCRRSESRNHMKELCEGLQMKGGFVCEFEELESPLRQPRDEGGGIHGNAILSKFDIDFRIVDHRYHGYDWDKNGTLLREPRKGRRYTLASVVRAPHLPPILCYCVHLEVFAGITDRVAAFSEVFHDASLHKQDIPHQAIFGDLNTMAHSIARLSPKYARDRYRFLSLGETESEWWDKRVLSFHEEDGPVNTRLATFKWLLPSFLLLKWPALFSGLTMDVLKMARNPGFYDPWDPNEVTLENPMYFGLFKAKLDWTLVRCMDVKERWRGNEDYKASDHVYLMVEVVPDDKTQIEEPEAYALWRKRRRRWRKKVAIFNASWQRNLFALSLGLGLASLALFHVCSKA